LEDKPFVLLGICTPIVPNGLRTLIDNGEVTWRVWFDEHGSPPGREGPRLAHEWRPGYRPRSYVIDHKGIIRHKGLSRRDEVRAVEQLLRELEKEQGAS
jgi:hypothetical protein